VELANAGEWILVRLRLTTQVPALMEYSSSLVNRVDQGVLEQRTKAFEEKQRAQQRLTVIGGREACERDHRPPAVAL
jgi:hypothetical protein